MKMGWNFVRVKAAFALHAAALTLPKQGSGHMTHRSGSEEPLAASQVALVALP